jgi:phosphohistidine phosphatase
MKTLLLLRHAKAEPDSPTGEDFDRPLAVRGRTDAGRMGAWLAGRGLLPELIVTSPSARTTETVRFLQERLPRHLKVMEEPTIYLGSAAKLLACIHGLAEAIDVAMIVAHNPGMGELALELARRGPRTGIERMEEKFPTCALAIFESDVARWDEIERKTSRLIDFYTPHDLDD